MSFSSISESNPYHNSILQIGENGDDATYAFCISSPLPPAPPVSPVPPAFTDTHLNMCKFDWEDRGGFMIVAFLHNFGCSGQM